MDAANAPVDMERVKLTSDGDKEFECELFALFLDDCATRIEALAEALSKSDQGAAAREAHTIKGSSSNVGALELHAAALAIERLMRTGEHRGIDEALERLRNTFTEVEQFMREYMAD